MPESPLERRRRLKAPVPAASTPTSEPPRARATPVPGLASRAAIRGAMIWPLVTGLAIGFACGREAWRVGLSDTRAEGGAAAPSTAFIAADPAMQGPTVQGATADPQPGWVKASDIGNGATIFAGLTEPQKTTVMAALNQRNCECGCAFGTLAQCLHKDPNCPRSPMLAKLAADLVKQGKSLPEILAAVDAKQKDMAQ